MSEPDGVAKVETASGHDNDCIEHVAMDFESPDEESKSFMPCEACCRIRWADLDDGVMRTRCSRT